jgi:hypothetical protein
MTSLYGNLIILKFYGILFRKIGLTLPPWKTQRKSILDLEGPTVTSLQLVAFLPVQIKEFWEKIIKIKCGQPVAQK